MLSVYIFYFLSLLALFGAIMMVFSHKPVYNVLYLTLTFFAIGGHYILLNAQFLAIVHIIVYTGAIMVLFLFTVMLLNLNPEKKLRRAGILRLIAVIAGGLLLITLVGIFKDADILAGQEAHRTQIGLVKNIGKVLYTDFLLPFEISSVLFLSAMVGAVMLGKKDIN